MSSVPPGATIAWPMIWKPKLNGCSTNVFGEVGPAGADARQRQGLGLHLVREVDPQLGGAAEVQAVIAELLEVRLERCDAPELRRRVHRVGGLVTDHEDEPARRGADRAEADHVHLAREGEDEHQPRVVDLEDHLGADVHERLVEEVAGLQHDAARQFDEERGALLDEAEGSGCRRPTGCPRCRPSRRRRTSP